MEQARSRFIRKAQEKEHFLKRNGIMTNVSPREFYSCKIQNFIIISRVFRILGVGLLETNH